ncbi:MAG: hypothetical protein JRJ86_11485 [Deltaproteobacteria bacterium]|nr:hypothetical protein [Deltaproteobacteria bacterium]MBW2344009.1 hypothetical protein [Deltaproteobacteria bacterium]
MFGIGLTEIIILLTIAAIIFSPIVIVIAVLAYARGKKKSNDATINLKPPPLPTPTENTKRGVGPN